MEEIKISVVVPVYNISEYLDESLGSLAAQNFPDAEFLCIDDGSSDDSLSVIEKWAARDSRFVPVHKENGGVSSARNLGLTMAKGSWVMFLDGDDKYKENALETVWRYVQEKHPDIIIFNADTFPVSIETEEWYKKTLRFDGREYGSFSEAVLDERGSRPFTWRHVYKREVIDRLTAKYDEGLNVGEDTQFPMCVFPGAERFLFVSDCLVSYRLGRSGSAMDESAENMNLIVGQHFDTICSVAGFWKEHGFMELYGGYFLKWALKFTLLKVKALPAQQRKIRAAEFFSRIVGENGLEQYRHKTGIEGAAMWKAFRLMIKI